MGGAHLHLIGPEPANVVGVGPDLSSMFALHTNVY